MFHGPVCRSLACIVCMFEALSMLYVNYIGMVRLTTYFSGDYLHTAFLQYKLHLRVAFM